MKHGSEFERCLLQLMGIHAKGSRRNDIVNVLWDGGDTLCFGYL